METGWVGVGGGSGSGGRERAELEVGLVRYSGSLNITGKSNRGRSMYRNRVSDF